MSGNGNIGLSAGLLSEAFPFHFALDRSMTFVRCGAVLERLCAGVLGRRLTDKIQIVTPQIEPTFDLLRKQQKTLFLCKIVDSGLTLKGQIAHEAWCDQLLFLGGPWITDVSRLAELGLTLGDFATQDPLTDLLFLIQAKNTALSDAKRLTERIKDQSARLRESERRYRTVVDSVREVIFQTDSEGRWTFLNPAWAAMTGCPVEACLGRSVIDFVHSDDREVAASLLGRTLDAPGEDAREAIRFATKDGGIRWIEIRARASVESGGAGRGLIGTLDDITDRMLAEQAQRRSQEELARTSRLKDEFLANMSHELRTPLNSVLGLTEALLESAYGPINDAQASFLRTIEESGRHLLSLISDILDLSKADAGTLSMDVYPVSPEDVCAASLRLIKQAAAKKKLRLSHSVEGDIPEVIADERRLKQVLVNLLSNAVKFTLEGGEVGLDVTFESAKSAVSFSVWDTGIGMSPEGMALLFKPFVQLDGGLARKHEGAGLGLALAYRFVEMQLGSISVESAEGKGSRFTVRLPAQEPAPRSVARARPLPVTAAKVPAPRPSSTRADGSPFTLLLAEDNELNIRTLQPYLEQKGYVVHIARDGLEALSAVESARPDAVLMDIQMPGMDGMEAIRRIRAAERDDRLPIVALTALAMPGDRQRCLDAGADAYVSKPIRLSCLHCTVQMLLGQPVRCPDLKEHAA